MWIYSVIFISELIIMCSRNVNSSELRSTYSKVTHWGTGQRSLPNKQNRHISSQRADVQSTTERASKVAYYYSMKAPFKLDESTNMEQMPGLGEVQERFIPRPYFDSESNYEDTKPSVVYGTPVPSSDTFSVNLTDSFIAYNPSNPKIPNNLYESPFTSYNPPKLKPESNAVPNYPPTDTVQNSSNLVNGFSISKPSEKPLDIPYYPSNPPSMDAINFPAFPSKLPLNNEEYENHPSPHGEQFKSELKPDIQEDQYLSVPPQDFHGKIPQFAEYDSHAPHIYESHYIDHPVYHEVKTTTTTTTPEPPQERDGHYSYYYLGRKLWYIPLYFSVYFIVYVTILILKSIARHKIRFSHHFDKENGRSDSRGNIEHVNQVHQRILTSIDNINQKYM